MRYGAIIGDIAGQRLEGKTFFQEEFPEDGWYFGNRDELTLHGRFTDDTVTTLAVAVAVMIHRKTGAPLDTLAVQQLQRCKAYAHRGFGGSFFDWMYKSDPQPYGSYGNGAAMRISPVAWFAESYEEAMQMTEQITNITHNHEDALYGAKLTVAAIWMLRQTKNKEITEDFLRKEFGFEKEKVVNKGFQINCRLAVNLALKSFLDADSFEDTLYRAIRLGGDTDTIAAIAGSIAESYYEIPERLIEQAEAILNTPLPDYEEPNPYSFFRCLCEWKPEAEPKHKQKNLFLWKMQKFLKKDTSPCRC